MSEPGARLFIGGPRLKKPWLAFLLNFIFAGAGIAYLGMWGWAALDLVLTIVLAFVFASKVPESFVIASGVIPATNGVMAMQVAKQVNAMRAVREAAAQASNPVAKP